MELSTKNVFIIFIILLVIILLYHFRQSNITENFDGVDDKKWPPMFTSKPELPETTLVKGENIKKENSSLRRKLKFYEPNIDIELDDNYLYDEGTKIPIEKARCDTLDTFFKISRHQIGTNRKMSILDYSILLKYLFPECKKYKNLSFNQFYLQL